MDPNIRLNSCVKKIFMLQQWSAYLMVALVIGIIGCNDGDKNKTNILPIPTSLKDYADSVNAGLVVKDTMKKSVQRVIENTVEGTTVRIQYYSPGVRGRQIWGGLIPYDQVWSAGAHSATHIYFSTDIKVAQTKMPAGDYAFFAIPGKEEWTLLLNKNYQQHLADDYNDSLDMVRVQVKPVILEDTVQRLTYLVKPNGEGTASIQLYWEKLLLTMPFSIEKNSSDNHTSMGGSKSNNLKSLVTKYKRDPVCYMPISAGISDTTLYKKEVVGFCSPECKNLFVNDPNQYLKNLK
jgi:YHS domain-containing protein